MEKVRMGILGIGNMGTAHLKNVMEGKCPEIEVTACCDLKAERLDYVKEVSGGKIACFEKAEDMMDSGLIDAVLVAVPHYDHPRYAIAAMERGLHAMVEKPSGVYTKQVREMNEMADKCSVKFGMMFNQRTNCLYRKMKEIIESGELGQIRRTSWIITDWYRPQAYYDSGNWRATWRGEGGGVLLNQCPHQLDLWCWICGMPKKVTAFLKFGQWHNIEVEDDVTAYVEYENGATGTFITTTGDVPGSNRFEITCEGGKLVAEGGKLKMWKLAMTEPEFSKVNEYPFAKPDMEVTEVELDGSHPEHPGVLNAFAAAILRGEDMIADGREGINGLTLSNAMHLSAFLGKTVEIPFDEDVYYEELKKRIDASALKESKEKVFVNIDSSYGS
ncbi:MAG: Gfo/Idh/MocA family oxidoreductase [Clostridia bacterium]|nr:Gfo/Idh/MocA family oxidoreductase [Clostridia bacterium]